MGSISSVYTHDAQGLGPALATTVAAQESVVQYLMPDPLLVQ